MLPPASTRRRGRSLACMQPGWLGRSGGRVGAVPQGRRGKAKAVVSLEAALLRQHRSGTEKDLFRKHKSYFAHMDDNKAT